VDVPLWQPYPDRPIEDAGGTRKSVAAVGAAELDALRSSLMQAAATPLVMPVFKDANARCISCNPKP
jgi:hypothetical protein